MHVIMQPFWNAVVARVPTWVAPNMLTLAGLVVNVLTTLNLVYHTPALGSTEPVRCGWLLCSQVYLIDNASLLLV